MTTKEIRKEEWQLFFDDFYKDNLQDGQTEYIEIRVLSEEGDQPEVSWSVLEGISYNPREDMLNIKVEDLDRMIWHPTQIFIEEDEGLLVSLEIIESDDTKYIIELR